MSLIESYVHGMYDVLQFGNLTKDALIYLIFTSILFLILGFIIGVNLWK